MVDRNQYFPVRTLMDIKSSIKTEKMIIENTANKSGMTEQLFNSHIKPVVDIYRPVLSPLACHRSHTIYRARKCENDAPYTDLKKDLYNPPVPSGRAFAEEYIPILYASSSFQTALSEIGAKIGDLVNVMQLSYEAIKDNIFWFVGQLGHFYKSYELSRYIGDEGASQFHAYIGDQRAVNSLVYKDLLFNEVFSELSTEQDDYVLNRFLINAVREKVPSNSDFSGVVFKSCKDSPGTNFAIFGEAIEMLEPKMVNLVRITGVDDYGCIEYRLLKNATPRNNPLQWPEEEITVY